jgi:uncharacterized protein GlcG (DUF336 family)
MKSIALSFLFGVTLGLIGCGGGGQAVSPVGAATSTGCTGSCASPSIFLSAADVEQVLAQGIAEAQARKVNATLAVVDRVGNVLAVYRMGAAATRTVLIASTVDGSGNPTLHSGLDGIRLPAPTLPTLNIDAQAAIAKAVTGAYLSSEGNAFSTRTASQIIQEHFNVGEANTPSGPLFGVQFSQLACSDFVAASPTGVPNAGPHRSPLGLAADPGGFPLYKNGTVVGGVGVIADGLYSLDKDIETADANVDDEAIAFAASYLYAAPVDRRADQLTVNGVTLRFSDVDESNLVATPGVASTIATFSGSGALISVLGYADGQIHAGTAFTDPLSGVRADTGDYAAQGGYVFVDASNVPRYAAAGGQDGPQALNASEVKTILNAALGVANQARAQIRLPLGLTAQVNISVVDTLGNILGLVRTRDAPMFGADVSIQKARTAAFLSSSNAAPVLQALPPAQYLQTDASGYPQLNGGTVALVGSGIALADYVTAARSFVGIPTLFADGAVAFSNRAVGDLARPYYPDGIEGAPNGPLSKPISAWSIFSTGLQLDLSVNAILQHVLYSAGAGVPDVSPGCIGVQFPSNLAFVASTAGAHLANGLQIFAGSVPIYRGNTLVGSIGVSGDGTQQDDMIAFLGLQNAIDSLGGTLSQAPAAIRSDTLTPQGTRLQYVQCPQDPFVNSTQENVCESY